jgi:hypothetical protein
MAKATSGNQFFFGVEPVCVCWVSPAVTGFSSPRRRRFADRAVLA